jgi:signal transduction histidine kinase
MTTKKQKREAVAARRAEYDAETKRLGQQAIYAEQMRREQRQAAIDKAHRRKEQERKEQERKEKTAKIAAASAHEVPTPEQMRSLAMVFSLLEEDVQEAIGQTQRDRYLAEERLRSQVTDPRNWPAS